MKAQVYIIHNLITKRNYAGSTTTGKVEFRVSKHMYLLRTQRHREPQFQKDYDRYGEESFVWKSVGKYDYNEAKRMEIFMMKVLRSQDERYGYNCKDKSGTSKYAIIDRWRTPTREWSQFTRGLYTGKR